MTGRQQATRPGVIQWVSLRFYHDQRLLILLLLLILVAGLTSFAVLPRMEDPVLRRRVALVNTQLSGADAKRTETLVTEVIEDRLRDIEEIKELRSVSRVGISSVVVELRDEVMDTEAVWSRVRSRLNDAIPLLPEEASRPRFEELDARAFALILGVVWDSPSVSEKAVSMDDPSGADVRLLRRLATDLQDRLQSLPGTDRVDRFGDPGEEVEVRVDPRLAAAVGTNSNEVARRLRAYDVKETAGQLRSSEMQLLMEAGNPLDQLPQLGAIPVAHRDGRDVRLDEIASIHMGVPNPPGRAAMLNGKEAVVLGVMVRPGYRIDHWTAAADQFLKEYEAELPAGIRIESVLRQDDYVKDRLRSLASNLSLGAIAVTAVIWLLMGWRSALIVTLTLPLSSLMVLFGLRSSGIPMHQMSVTGLIIALGLLIDNAIVVVDEVHSRLRRGFSHDSAMSSSVSHLAVPLFGSTLTTALAFAPIALMPGPAGEFVGSIAVSVIFAIFSSLFLALTVIPTIAARSLRGGDSESQLEGDLNPIHDNSVKPTHWWGSGLRIRWLASALERLVVTCVRRPVLGCLLSVIAPLIGFVAFTTLDEQFFPPSGRNQFYITVERPATSSLRETRRTTAEVDRIARSLGANRIDWFFGESAPQFYYNVIANRRGTRNYSQGLVTLAGNTEPEATIRRLQAELNRQILSSRVLVRQLEQGPPFAAPIEVRLFGPDLEVLSDLGHEVRKWLSGLPEVVAVRADLDEVLPQISFNVDVGAATQAGTTPRDIASQLAGAMDGMPGGSILQDNEELPIIVRVQGEHRGDLSRVGSMDIMLPANLPRSADGTIATTNQTTLAAITTTSLVPKYAAIPRLNRQRMNEVAAYLQAGVLPSVVQRQLQTMVDEGKLDLPTGYFVEFGGEASKRDDAVGNLFSTVGVLAVLMLATLVLSFGSFRLAGIISVVAVLSVGLSVGALAASGFSFGFMAIIGTMGLIGVAINDSIVVLAGIRANPLAAARNVPAVVEEVMHSSRHVVATTLTTMAGFTPLILDGGGFWPPMAVCIAGGVAGATLLALVLVPSLHQLLAPKPHA